MSNENQPKGKCTYCGQEISMDVVTKHLKTCAQRQDAITKANGKQGEAETFYHLRAQSADSDQFWLDLEMCGAARLKDLDKYLRAIWLECCGHLSRFSIGGWQGKEIPMKRRTEEIFKPGIKLTHIYDFGTSSITMIKCVSVREGMSTTAHPIFLMARNLMPESKCIKCKKTAAWLCMECLINEDIWGTLCDKHAKSHPQ